MSTNATNIIALSALAATFWQAYLSRRHNRLSVKPHLEVATGFNFNLQEYYINILNNGLGPALITRIQLFIDGSQVNAQKSDVFSDVISELFHLYKYKEHYLIISDKYMMKSNEEKTFMKVELQDSLANFPVAGSEEIERISARIKISISYESMYGEKFTCT